MHGTSQGAAVAISGYGGLVTLADPSSVPEGASPRTYDTDFLVGRVQTRAGLRSIYNSVTAEIGPNQPSAAASSTWLNPGNILADDGNYASFGPAENPNFIDVTEFLLNIPDTSSITSIRVTAKGYANAPCDVSGQLLINGAPVGDIRWATLTTGLPEETVIIAQDLWGLFPTPAQLNALNFGVRLTAGNTVFGLATAYLDSVTVTVSLNTGTANFQFITTFTAQDGSVRNLSLDADGNFYVENVTTAPGVLNLITEGIAPNSYAVGVNGPDVEYLAFSDGISGSDMPLQYTTRWIDRITQVGPGASPIFTPIKGPNTQYLIDDITQNPVSTQQFIEQLWSSGPGSSSAGNVITIYYSQTEDTKLSSAFTRGIYPVYVYMTNLLFAAANGVFKVTGVGVGTPVNESGQTWYYFTYVIGEIGFGFNRQGTPGNYQITVAALITGSQSAIRAMAVNAGGAGWAVGDTFTIAGVTSGIGQVTAETGGVATAISIINGGSGAAVGSGIAATAVSPSTGTGLTVNVTSVGAAAIPVPGLQVGSQITVAENSVSAWNSAWTVLDSPNTSEMAITGSQVASGVATLSYAVVGGASAPAAGQLVTITGTTNANGALNVANVTIVSATGGSTGTFTISLSSPDFAFEAEDGQASTAGTIFLIDPGPGAVGTSTNPIYGTGTGGYLTFSGPSNQLIATGTKQGTVFFITRNGYYTMPGPPVTFTIPENTTGLTCSQIPIGPPNVIARGIAFTESGQNGTPGANFFTIPTPVNYIVNDIRYTATSLIINDNTTTAATFSFTDFVLLNALAIDVYGYNLFNQIEIGDPGWIRSYAGRNFYGLCRNKIQNFVNLSFDGGYLPASAPVPLGWTPPDVYGSLVPSAKFGNAYYIGNTSNGTLAVAGLISQSAFQDAYLQPILNSNTLYSVRVSARIPSGLQGGNLLIALVSNGVTLGSFTLPFANMTTNYATYTGTLLTAGFQTVPAGLQLQVSATELVVGADVEIDRIEPFPTAIPILATTVYGSYAGLPEQVDGVTGQVKFESENQQPVNGAMVMYDTLYAFKGWGGTAPGSSMYSLQQSANLEPAQWNEPEVAQKTGACGILAYDFGEQWLVMANRTGLYLFEGGQPGKIMQEIFQVWDAINWKAAKSIWVLNDSTRRRLFVGVPLPTPNFWLPNAPENAAPTVPNVVLMCNYQGLDSGQQIKSSPEMHTTMFGTLNAIDMRRKWSIWQIPSPYAAIVQGASDQEIAFCNGRANSNVYALDDTMETDDGLIIDSLYTTAGIKELSKRQEAPQLGFFRTRWGYMVAQIESLGNVAVTLYPNRLMGPGTPPDGYTQWTVPGGFSPGNPALNDAEAPLNFAATRTYVEFRENDGHGFNVSNLVLKGIKDTWNALRGAK